MIERLVKISVLLFAPFLAVGVPNVEANEVTLVIVTGIPGAEEYEEVFSTRTERWREAGERAGAEVHVIGETESEAEVSDRERLKAIIDQEAKEEEGQLWLILNGHGTYDGEVGKFNLRGRDVSAKELSDWLSPCQRDVAVVNGFSASAPFIHTLSAPGRVVISATKSGYELNFSRFGEYVSEAIGSLEADLDKDGQVSLLEMFLRGARETDEFYALDGRLASEHAVLDDTGDKLGTTFDFYRGVRLVKKAKENAKPDGRRAHQFHLIRSEFERQMPEDLRAKRDELEMQVLALRDQRSTFEDESLYFESLEMLLLQLAAIYGEVESIIEAKSGSSEANTEVELPDTSNTTESEASSDAEATLTEEAADEDAPSVQENAPEPASNGRN